MSTARSIVPALGAGFLATFSGGGEKLAFQPEAGASLQKTFTIHSDFSLDEMTLIVDGQDVGGMLGAFEMSVQQETKIEITDLYRSLAEGRPKELLRTFDALAGTMHLDMSMGENPIPQMPEMTSSSPLEGKTVAFRWNDEDDAFDVSFHEGEGDQKLLQGLKEDMDLRAFLPQKEVAKDDSWTVALGSLDSIAMPGGNLVLTPEGVDVDEDSVKMFEELFAGFGKDLSDMLEGKCVCTYKGTQGEKDSPLAEIALEIEVATTIDMSGPMQKAIQKVIQEQGGSEAPEISLDTADLNLDFDGSGTLLWDLKAGRVHSFHLAGDVTIGIDLEVGLQAEGESHEMSASLEMSGSLSEEVETKE